jgi:hypothetical protein
LSIIIAEHQWLTPVILDTQDYRDQEDCSLKREIRRIMVQSQPRQNSWRDPISKEPITKKGWWSGFMCR